MIEPNIVNWIDLGDTMQSLEIYGKVYWLNFFKFLKILLKHKNISIFAYIILKFFYFLQIIMINLTNVNILNDPDTIFSESSANLTSYNSTLNLSNINSTINLNENN